MEDREFNEIRGVTAKLDLFWLALAAGEDADVGERLAAAGFNTVVEALQALHDDILLSAQDLRDRREIEQAVEMERFADQIAAHLGAS